MATSRTKITAKGLRTLRELRDGIPMGGSCWVIHSNHHTKEPQYVMKFIRESASVLMSEAMGDEEHMRLSMTLQDLVRQPYGGAWLKKKDAQKYLALLQKFWRDAPQTIDALAQELEKKDLH